jgi:hypothetical protein
VERYLAGPKRKGRDKKVKPGPRHMNAASLISLFHDYERSIGLSPLPRRAWYGLRRVLADMGEDHTSDTRVLREITGWTHEETRRRYQKREDPKVLRAAAETRRSIRQAARSSSEAPGKDENVESEIEHGIDLTTLSLDQLRALLKEADLRLKEEK